MGDVTAAGLLYSARPVIRLDNVEEPDLADGLLSLSVRETTDGLYSCEATFGNWSAVDGSVGYLYFDRQVFDFGREISITMGKGETAATVFEGRITAIEGRYPQHSSPELLILAEDRLQDLRMVRRTRAFEEVTDQDVFEQIAQQHSLQTDIQVDGPSYPVLAQVNQSDLAFIRDRARSIDAEVWVEADTLHVQQREHRDSGEVSLSYGQLLHDFSVVADLAEQRTNLSLSGWDTTAKETIDEQVGSSAIQSELNGSESGSQILESAFGTRDERIVHAVPLTPQEAQFHAKSHYRKMARRFVCGRACAEGDGRIRVGTHVQLSELGALFDGTYFVTEVQHTFDPMSGYLTSFCVQRPGLGGN